MSSSDESDDEPQRKLQSSDDSASESETEAPQKPAAENSASRYSLFSGQILDYFFAFCIVVNDFWPNLDKGRLGTFGLRSTILIILNIENVFATPVKTGTV